MVDVLVALMAVKLVVLWESNWADSMVASRVSPTVDLKVALTDAKWAVRLVGLRAAS